MLKTIIIIAIAVLLGVSIYYTRYLFTKKIVNEAFPLASVSASPDQTAAAPQPLKIGSFNEIDLIHKGSGRALLYTGADGKHILRFEDFSVTNGPDLYVYLTKNPTPKDKASLGEFITVGRLKGTDGNQNYEIADLPADYNTVVIWCQRFSVLFSYAILR